MPKKSSAITIYEIAKEAGVSVATVSRALGGRAGVGAETRKKIEALVKKYNYHPNIMARGLKARTRTIGIIAADICNPYYAMLVVACEIAASEKGYTVTVCNVLKDNRIEYTYIEKLRAQRVDAIVQLGSRADDIVQDTVYAARLNEIGIPYITTGYLSVANAYYLPIDDSVSMRLIMEHLAANGHKKIALLGGRSSVKSTFNKSQYYIYQLGKLGLPFIADYVRQGDYSVESGYTLAHELIDLSEWPTAIIAINDYTAAGIYRALNERGLSVPSDISVISFDNTLSEILQPRLTSIDYNYAMYGRAIIHTAISAIEGEHPPRESKITPTLVIRDSVRCIDG